MNVQYVHLNHLQLHCLKDVRCHVGSHSAFVLLSCHMYWPTLQWSQTVRDGAHGLV